ncbi:MAG: glycosyltransferase 87 family protein [Bacteroidia bacterium]|nr:glycosyltransferase 87 family protein [Bacteroidia bacterium]
MITKFLTRISKLTKTKRRVYLIGLFFAFLITFKEVIRLSYNNFQIFSYGSIDFWTGINPYSDWKHLSVLGKPLDNFLYGPLFSILFTPFAHLPGWLGVFCWNIFTYTLFYFSVFTLPAQFSFVKKKFIFFFTALLLFATLLSIQFNPVVAAMFLFSFTLLEKKQGFWAVLLIFLSGFTKVFGIFQIAMLLFYPGFWKNALYAVLIGIVFFLFPLVHIPVNELVVYYQSWIVKVMDHSEALLRFSIYRPVCLLYNSIEPFVGLISLGVFFVILAFTFLKLTLFKESLLHRAQFLGIIMSWAILFSVGSERHTYVIAVVGYAIWYLCSIPTRTDKVLLWINFVLLGILPIDILCPWVISNFILAKLNLGIIIFTITWGIMVYKTFTSRLTS